MSYLPTGWALPWEACQAPPQKKARIDDDDYDEPEEVPLFEVRRLLMTRWRDSVLAEIAQVKTFEWPETKTGFELLAEPPTTIQARVTFDEVDKVLDVGARSKGGRAAAGKAVTQREIIAYAMRDARWEMIVVGIPKAEDFPPRDEDFFRRRSGPMMKQLKVRLSELLVQIMIDFNQFIINVSHSTRLKDLETRMKQQEDWRAGANVVQGRPVQVSGSVKGSLLCGASGARRSR